MHGIALEFHSGWPWEWFHARLFYILNTDDPLARAVLPAPKPRT